jgi:CubicO group peptidase (beta-lactamase class C family)
MTRGRATWLAGLVLVWSVVTACTASRPDSTTTPEPTLPATSPVARDYWPTTGWRTAAASQHGIEAGQLDKVEDQVDQAYPGVRSVLVVRHGYLVYEHYRQGLSRTSGHDVQSVTKSVVGALVGIALAEGKVQSLDQPIAELLPAQLPAAGDPRFAQVTVKHLLTMTSGLPGDDPGRGGDPRVSDAMFESADWVRHIVSQPLQSDPGTRFAYSNGTAHLLSAILAEVSDQSTLNYARVKLFEPLGIRTDKAFEPRLVSPIDPDLVKAYERASVAWPTDPQGFHYGGGFLRLPAREVAKFGYLYLNGGRWDGQQVIPADYVVASTSAAGSSPNVLQGYGWLWWVGTEGGRTYFARGYGGQFIYVVPELDLVVVVTSDAVEGGLDPRILITQTIIPAVSP